MRTKNSVPCGLVYMLKKGMFLIALIMVCSSSSYGVDISDSPPEVQVKAASPNFMIGLDDSGSMDWEVMCKGVGNGYFRILVGDSYKNFAYVLPNPGDNLYSDSSYLIPADTADVCTKWDHQCIKYEDVCVETKPICLETKLVCIRKVKGKCVQWEEQCIRVGTECVRYENQCTDSVDVCLETGAGFSYRAHWRSQWAGPNTLISNIPTITASSASNPMYYNPRVKYEPWYGFSNANPNTPASHPNSSVSTKTINLDAVYNIRGTVNIPNAHYYVWSETDKKAFLVTLSGGAYKYYEVDGDGDGIVETGETEIKEVGSIPDDVKIKRPNSEKVNVEISYSDERQNFANWYSFHRKRWLAAVGAISHMVPQFSGVNVGLYSINANIVKSVVPAKVYNSTTGLTADESATIINAVTSYKLKAEGTPLRTALNTIGDYLTKGNVIGPNPRASSVNGGACQQNFAMLFTDGYWNDSSPPTVGDQDGVKTTVPANLGTFSGIDPYKDTYSDTLADVAMKYYKNDMDTNLENVVPKNNVDQATHQHMVTYTVGFGLDGTLDRGLYNTDVEANYPTWPKITADSASTIDDLWHAAVNGRGKYLSAANSQELLKAFTDIVTDVSSRMGSAAAVTMNGIEVNDKLKFYQSMYSAAGWTGDLISKTFPTKDGKPLYNEIPSVIMWSASNKIADMTYDNRKIISYSYDGATAKGIPFRFASLNDAQKSVLYPDYETAPAAANNLLNYLRGDNSKEARFTEGIYRNRLDDSNNPSKIGDVIHSAPLFYENIVYVGSNDGMLHAFNAVTGTEVFAYVPNLVYSNLSQLSATNYSHIPFVDGSPYARKAGTNSYLVGGLGKGGKGIYCLDITNVGGNIADEASAADAFAKWEYPKVDHYSESEPDPDMGYSFSRPIIVNTDAGWVVIFGNGYNSTNKKAVLYIVDLATGNLLKKIDTGSGGDNGLSTPVVVDVDANGKSDYVYAGDLNGNMWKFEIKGATIGETATTGWKLAYDTKPLFTAKDSSGKAQPITSRPDVMLHCKADLPGYIIVFGTGKWLGVTDLTNPPVDTVYGIWDYGDDCDDTEYVGTINKTSTNADGDAGLDDDFLYKSYILKQQVKWTGEAGDFTQDDSVRILTAYKATWSAPKDYHAGSNCFGKAEKNDPSLDIENHVGWYFDLPSSGERIVNDIQIRNNNAIIVSSVPSVGNPCSPEGTSWLYEINACTGARAENSHLDIKKDGTLDDNDTPVVTVDDPNDRDKTLTKKIGASAVHYTTLIYPPSIARDKDNTEIKFMSTSEGTILGMREKGEAAGIYYWRSK